MKRRAILHDAILPALLAGCVLTLACGGGGGGGGGMIPGGVSAVTFTPDSSGDVAMASGGSVGANFSIDIMVDDLDDLFGAAFRVTHDPGSANFVGVSSTGSILVATGAQTQFTATPLGSGQVAVVATLLGQGFCSSGSSNAGTNCTTAGDCPSGTCQGGIVNATGRLVRLNYVATQVTGGNAFAYSPAGREITICATAGQPCTNVAGTSSFSGGSMAAL